MPDNNKYMYKEMYQMGEKLMSMAKEGGYTPEDSGVEEQEEMQESAPKKDRAMAALSFYGKE